MSRSVLSRVSMSRSAALSNMCSMISYPNGPAQAKDRPGLGICFGWNGRLRWWLRISLGGWLGTSDACGRSPWHGGSGRPPESAQKRGAFHRIPLPHFRPDLTRRTRPGTTKATPATVNTHRRTATPPTKGETSPRTHPSRNPRGGTRPRDPIQPVPRPSSPPRHPSGDRANPPIPDQPRPPNGPSGNPTPGPNSAAPVPLVAASSPQRGPRQPTDPGPTPATERPEREPHAGTQLSS